MACHSERKWDYETDTRTVLRISKLYDVSIVDVPAYDSTEVYARSKEEYENEKRQYQEMKLEKEKLNLLLSL